MNVLSYMKPFYSSKQNVEKETKEIGILSKKFNFLNILNGKFFFCEHSYHSGNNLITKQEYENFFFKQELAKVDEKIEKLKLLSFEEKKQLIYEQLVLKFKVEKSDFEIKYGKNSTYNLIQKY